MKQFCYVLAGILLCGHAAEAAVIRLRPEATVATGVILLRDVADLADPDPQMVLRLGAVTLAPVSSSNCRAAMPLAAELSARIMGKDVRAQ